MAYINDFFIFLTIIEKDDEMKSDTESIILCSIKTKLQNVIETKKGNTVI